MTDIPRTEDVPGILLRIRETSAVALASELAIPVEEIDRALREASTGGAAQEEAWWPELLRCLGRESLRCLARRFGTNPRRIRRALARSSIRVGGVDLGEEGVERLEPFRERLGQEPDSDIAAEAGVMVEAVQGERRRFGIEPYRPLSEEEAWAPDPFEASFRPRERYRRFDRVEPEVYRRRASVPITPRVQVFSVGESQFPALAQAQTLPSPPAEPFLVPAATPGAPASDQAASPNPPVTRGTGRRRLVRHTAMQQPESPPAPTWAPRSPMPRRVSRTPVKVTRVTERRVSPEVEPSLPELPPTPVHKSLGAGELPATETQPPFEAPGVEAGASQEIPTSLPEFTEFPEFLLQFGDLPPSADEILVARFVEPSEASRSPQPVPVAPEAKRSEPAAVPVVPEVAETAKVTLDSGPGRLDLDCFAWRIDFEDAGPMLVVAPDILHAIRLAQAHLSRVELGAVSVRKMCDAFSPFPVRSSGPYASSPGSRQQATEPS